MGQPLKHEVFEYYISTSGSCSTTRHAVTSYAYWGADKYFQQKAVKDPAGRYSFTDYYDCNASQGSRGQTKKVYSSAFASFLFDTVPGQFEAPSGTAAENVWRYTIRPQYENQHSAFHAVRP